MTPRNPDIWKALTHVDDRTVIPSIETKVSTGEQQLPIVPQQCS
jgi:hypothetical protein